MQVDGKSVGSINWVDDRKRRKWIENWGEFHRNKFQFYFVFQRRLSEVAGCLKNDANVLAALVGGRPGCVPGNPFPIDGFHLFITNHVSSARRSIHWCDIQTKNCCLKRSFPAFSVTFRSTIVGFLLFPVGCVSWPFSFVSFCCHVPQIERAGFDGSG